MSLYHPSESYKCRHAPSEKYNSCGSVIIRCRERTSECERSCTRSSVCPFFVDPGKRCLALTFLKGRYRCTLIYSHLGGPYCKKGFGLTETTQVIFSLQHGSGVGSRNDQSTNLNLGVWNYSAIYDRSRRTEEHIS